MKFPKPTRQKKSQLQKAIDRALGKKAKYRAEVLDQRREGGIRYDSKLEARVHQMLQMREKAGEISVLQLQAEVRLTDAEVIYKPDFRCIDVRTGEIFFVEAKGLETSDWRIKRRLWGTYGPGPLEIWKSGGGTFGCQLHEVIRPRGRKHV